MKDIKKCEGGKWCGWTEDGHYECFCHVPPKPDKLTQIKILVESYMPQRGAGPMQRLGQKVLSIINEE